MLHHRGKHAPEAVEYNMGLVCALSGALKAAEAAAGPGCP